MCTTDLKLALCHLAQISRCASYLVLYIDELLKSSLKGLSEQETDVRLDKVSA